MAMNTNTTVDMSEMPYNASGVRNFEGLFMRSNEFMDGGIGFGILLVVWTISFYSLNDYPVQDATTASTWITFLTSALLSLIEVIDPAFALLMLIASVALASYNHATK